MNDTNLMNLLIRNIWWSVLFIFSYILVYVLIVLAVKHPKPHQKVSFLSWIVIGIFLFLFMASMTGLCVSMVTKKPAEWAAHYRAINDFVFKTFPIGFILAAVDWFWQRKKKSKPD